MTQALTRIRIDSDAILLAPGTAAGFDPNITLHPRAPGRPFVRDWRVEEVEGRRELVLNIGVIDAPRGAA